MEIYQMAERILFVQLKEKGKIMICPHCQKPIPDGSAFCPRCGQKIAARSPAGVPPVPPELPPQLPGKASASPSGPNPKRSGKGLWIALGVGALLIAGAGTAGFLFWQNSQAHTEKAVLFAEHSASERQPEKDEHQIPAESEETKESEPEEKKETVKEKPQEKEAKKEAASKKEEKSAVKKSEPEEELAGPYHAYKCLFDMNVRAEPDAKAAQTDYLYEGTIVELSSPKKIGDEIWAQRQKGDWMCIEQGGEVYLEPDNSVLRAGQPALIRLRDVSLADFALDFRDGWLVEADGKLGYLGPDGLFIVNPVYTVASIGLDKTAGENRTFACLNDGYAAPLGGEPGTVGVCSTGFGGTTDGYVALDEDGQLALYGSSQYADGTLVKNTKNAETSGYVVVQAKADKDKYYVYDWAEEKAYGPYTLDHPPVASLVYPEDYSPEKEYDSHHSMLKYPNGMGGRFVVDSAFWTRDGKTCTIHSLDGRTLGGFDDVQVVSQNGLMAKKNGKTLLIDGQSLKVLAEGDYDFISYPVDGVSLVRKGKNWSLLDIK